jgi:hypothetical protein
MWQRGKHRGGISTRTACVCLAQLGSGGRRRKRERTANILLMSVTLEVSKLSGWLKAFAFCRVQRGHPTQGNACGTEVDVWHRGKGESAALVWRECVWPSSEWGQKRRRRKRTANIQLMSVTLEVSQLDIMSALKVVMLKKSHFMSMMAETSQSAMGPYVSVAVVGFSSYALTAICRSNLVMKVLHRSTGSHCGGQATPRAEGRAFELRWPMTCGASTSRSCNPKTAENAATPIRMRM